jgi:hypothetical protein
LALRKTREKKGNTCIVISRIAKADEHLSIRLVVIATDHMRDFKRERRVCDRLLRI